MPANHRSPDLQLLVALEAVLGTQQLSEIREMVRARVADAVAMGEEELWSVVLAVDELASAVLHQFERCPGLRVYRDGPSVRVEVDVPRPPSPEAGGDGRPPGRGVPSVQPPVLARQVIEALVSNWGVEHGSADRRWGVDPRPGGSTIWCLIDPDARAGPPLP
jgi:hypothetical protein